MEEVFLQKMNGNTYWNMSYGKMICVSYLVITCDVLLALMLTKDVPIKYDGQIKDVPLLKDYMIDQ